MRTGNAEKIVRSFFNAYLVLRDMEGTLACLTEDVQWIGTGESEIVNGIGQAEQALRTEFALSPEPYRIEYGDFTENVLTDACSAVMFTASVYPEPESAGALRIRVLAVCAGDGEEGGRIAAIHAYTPEGLQEEGEFFPASPLERSGMGRDVGEKSLDILGQNIPGGMMGGYLEPGFPLYYVNSYMLSYLGYTYAEFVEAIDGQVINCMHPEDRTRVDSQVADAFGAGMPYEIQYRMRKKDGSYIWVNDVGKKGLSEDGREICISVIRDITAEMEARERLEKQAARYDRLFQSVLTGIVQYRMTGNGVTFKNANQEAMRLFGYTAEEFWAKEDWDLPALIAEEDRVRILAEIGRLKKPGDSNPFEYRLVRKDGSLCWIIGRAEMILDIDGEQVIQSVFMDINERKMVEQRNERLAEQVEASNEILHLALEHTTACEFYYYPQTGICTVPERTCAIYHCRRRYDDMPGSFALELVDEEYHPVFYEMYEKIHGGMHTASCEFRGKSGTFWCRETLSVIRSSEDGAPQFVIGIVEDITRQKEMELALEETRSRDGLTGLYNKEKGIRLIQDYLNSRPAGENGVLMLLDMDDFAYINQKEGKVFADAILQEIADLLLAETSGDDIRVRLGGDEFMVFLKNCDRGQAAVIGPRIARLIRNILVNTEQDVHASVSIGMCSTEVADEYPMLYRCAESTLKYVKEHSKGKAASYLDTSNEVGTLLNQLYTGEHPVNEIEAESSLAGGDLVSFALELLGKSRNLDDAVSLLLARIGKTCGFDRVSIIEADRHYLTWHFSYQWARRRADLQLGQDFYVSEEDFELCSDMYDEDGLADHNLRDGISGIASCLHAGIWDYGEYVGSMSFEVDKKDYRWSKEYRRLLKELVRIVPSFIMKSKADAVSQAKTDFLSRMSHEIRTPMNAISGMTTIAKSVVQDPVKTLDCLNKIEASNIFLLNIVNDILDMSRIESGKLELSYGTLDLTRMLAGLDSLFHAQALEKGLTMRLEDGRTGNRPLRADSLRLNQVLVNIIGNAVKFTEHGGITVQVEELETKPRALLRFTVTDTGIGIDPSALSRIFNPFERVETGTVSRPGGTGLGLSISYRLVQMMGGVLEARSEGGKGSAFFFTLAFDYASEEGDVNEETKEAAVRRDFTGRKVLLAEDNEINREIAQTLLEMHGFTVDCAADGQEALDCFCDGKPGRYDVILMDIRMPVMDGLEAARRIRTSGRPDARTVPIIALSANAFDEDSRKSLESGMNGHVSKPVEVDKLLELLEECIRW